MAAQNTRAARAGRPPREAPGRRQRGSRAARRPKSGDSSKSDGIVAEIARCVAIGCGLAAAWAAACLLADGLALGADVLRGGQIWMI